MHVGLFASRGWWPPAWCKDCTHALSCADDRVAAGWGQGTAPALGAGGTAIAKPQLSSVAVTLDPSTPLAPEVRSLSLSCTEGKLHRGVRCNPSALARWCSAAQVLTLVMSGRSTPTAFIFTTAGGSTGGTSGTGSNTSPTAPTSLWRLTNVFVWNATTTVTSGVRPTYKLDIVSQSASYRVWTFDSTGAAVRYPIPTCFSATAGTTTSADTC